MAEHESDQSVFNMAMAYLKRLDNILYMCQASALKNDIDSWRQHLRAAYRELSVKLDEKEMLDIDGDYDKPFNLKELLDNAIKPEEATFANINRLSNNPQLRQQSKLIILRLLDALDIKIRKQLQAKGMLLPGRRDPRFAILGN